MVDGNYQHGGQTVENAKLSFTQEQQSPFTQHVLTSSETLANVFVPAEGEFVDDLSWTEIAFDVDSPANAWGAYDNPRILDGSLVDDLESLELLVENPKRPCTYVDLDRAAAVLRYVSEKMNPPD